MKANLELTESIWNPVTGYDKLSRHDKYCYQEMSSRQLKSMGVHKYIGDTVVRMHPESLKEPYSWHNPRLVQVNVMGDLFDEEVTSEFIKQVFKVMNNNPMHKFKLLTKQAERLLELSPQLEWTPNIWIGVSIEDELGLENVDNLRKSGAKFKFLSLEPLLGPLHNLNLNNIDLVIVGGERCPNARPMEISWVKEINEKCEEANVPIFLKLFAGKYKKKIDRMLDKRNYNENPKFKIYDKLYSDMLG